MPPQYDLCVYGATGFTGRLVARYLAQSAPPTLKWCIGGRSAERLNVIKQECISLNPSCASLAIVLGEGATISNIAKSAACVVSTAGPFSLYGEPLLAACIQNGSHYADITGETAWCERMEEKYGAEAKRTGSIVIPMCGLDSIPSDLGCFFAVQEARRRCEGAGVSSVRCYVTMKGTVSGGTIASGRAIAGDPGLAARSRDPFLLVPKHSPPTQPHPPSTLVTPTPDSTWPTFVGELQAYASHGVMAALNTRVVRRSAALFALLGREGKIVSGGAAPGLAPLPLSTTASSLALSPYAYSLQGTPFDYGEYSLMRSWWAAFTTKLGGLIIGALLFRPWFFPLVAGSLPKPGEGPSDETIAKGWFSYYILAKTQEPVPRTVAVKVSGGDPGYGDTAKMLAETGILLGTGGKTLPAAAFGNGFLTSSTALGMHLVEKLNKAGISFTPVEDMGALPGMVERGGSKGGRSGGAKKE